MTPRVAVKLWGSRIGHLLASSDEKGPVTFQFNPAHREWLKKTSHLQIAPMTMCCPPLEHCFPEIGKNSYKGLPGIFADSLPDRYGWGLIDVFMTHRGLDPEKFTSLDRLLYLGSRTMGALEYTREESDESGNPGESGLPTESDTRGKSGNPSGGAFDLRRLAVLAESVLKSKEALLKKLRSTEEREEALALIRIGSRAGGARSKALLATSPEGELFDGTVEFGADHRYWLLKFDSSGNRDRDRSDPPGLPVAEYIYSLIAREAGIEIPETRLISDGGTRHFMIERFDRMIRNRKVEKRHYASWCGLDHADREHQHSYEQLAELIIRMKLRPETLQEIFRRAVFNLMGRNQDDHSKNVGFLMDRSGGWRMSPAFDLTYSYDPQGRWTSRHQCSLNGKRENFEIKDLQQFGGRCGLADGKIREILEQTGEAFSRFSSLAREFDLPRPLKATIEKNLCLNLAL